MPYDGLRGQILLRGLAQEFECFADEEVVFADDYSEQAPLHGVLIKGVIEFNLAKEGKETRRILMSASLFAKLKNSSIY